MNEKIDLLAELKSRPIWAGYVPGIKAPMIDEMRNSKANDKTTWQTYESATKTFDDNVGIFADGSTLLIDFDHITKDGTATDGIIDDPIAKKFLEECDTYTECSPSKTGAHAIYFVTEPLELETHTYHVDKSIGRKYEYWANDNRFFTVTQNSINNLPIKTINADEALKLLTILGYNRKKDVEMATIDVSKETDNTAPWVWINTNVSWNDILEPHDWKEVSRDHWERPGKNKNTTSATTNFKGLGLFHVFSTSAEPFEADKSYPKFQAWAKLNHNGDTKIACKEFINTFPEYRSLISTNTFNSEITESDTSKVEQKDLFKMYSYDEIQEWNVSIDWFVKGVIPVGGIVTLAAPSGVGKTWLSLHISKCLTSGGNFLDNPDFETRLAKTLYIDAENPPAVIRDRTRKLQFTSTDNFKLMSTPSMNLTDPENLERLKKIVLENHFKVVMIDTFRAVVGGLEENESSKIRPFISQLYELRNLGVTIIFLDHTRKPERFDGITPRQEQLTGSQDKVSAVEVVLMIVKNNKTGMMELHQVKNRFAAPIKPISYSVTDNKNDTTSLLFQGFVDNDKDKKTQIVLAREAIPAILESGPKTRKEIIAESNVGEKNTEEAMKQLVAENRLIKGKRGNSDLYTLVDTNSEEFPS